MNADPKFTAYALNELSETEKKDYLENLLASGQSLEDIEKEAQSIRLVGEGISGEFKKDQALRLSPSQREKVFPKEKFNFVKWVMGGASGLVAASLAMYFFLPTINQKVDEVSNTTFSKAPDTALIDSIDGKSLGGSSSGSNLGVNKMAKSKKRMKPQAFGYGAAGAGAAPLMESESIAMDDAAFAPIPSQMPGKHIVKGEKSNRENYKKIETNPYTLVSNQPLSTFSVDVDTASYANMRRFLLRGQLPPKNSVRVEELINYFHYDYDFKQKDHPVAIKVDQSVSPWNKDRKLVRVALKADSPSKLTTAKKNLVFLMDVSGSMSDPKKLPLLKESMRLLVRKLKPEDTISLVVYAGAAGVVLEPTPVKEKLTILKALENLNAGGSTNGGAGIIAAYKMAKQAFIKGGVNRVILATDGDFNVGTSSQGALIDMIEEKAKQDIFLTVVGLGMGNYQDAMLEKISNKGNGNYAYIDSLSEANKLFNIDLEKNLVTVAQDVKVQIEFNPAKVAAYRLVGYENRMLKAQDFNNDKKDAGEMGAGHNVTALYEIVPAGGKIDLPKIDKLKYGKTVKANNDSKDLLTVKVRYKEPTADTSKKFEVVLKDGKNKFESMDQDFRFATTVASFGLKLRGDKLAKDLSYRDLISMAREAKGQDDYDFREELIEMIELAKQIDK